MGLRGGVEATPQAEMLEGEARGRGIGTTGRPGRGRQVAQGGGRVSVEMRQLVGQLVVWAGTHTGSTADEDREPWQNQCGDKLEMSRFNCWCGPSWRCIGLGGWWGVGACLVMETLSALMRPVAVLCSDCICRRSRSTPNRTEHQARMIRGQERLGRGVPISTWVVDGTTSESQRLVLSEFEI